MHGVRREVWSPDCCALLAREQATWNDEEGVGERRKRRGVTGGVQRVSKS